MFGQRMSARTQHMFPAVLAAPTGWRSGLGQRSGEKGRATRQPLTAAGLRRVFRYHREISGVAAGHPQALRHAFGTALAEAGVDLPLLQALMGHDHADSSAAYIHLAPAHVRAAYDAARERLYLLARDRRHGRPDRPRTSLKPSKPPHLHLAAIPSQTLTRQG
jgi:integrase